MYHYVEADDLKVKYAGRLAFLFYSGCNLTDDTANVTFILTVLRVDIDRIQSTLNITSVSSVIII